MKVILERDFYGPDQMLYRARKGVAVEIPDALRDQLPATAKVEDGKPAPAAETKAAPAAKVEAKDDAKAKDDALSKVLGDKK